MKHGYKAVFLAALIISSMTAGCSVEHRIYHSYSPRPLYPELGYSDKYPVVDSLQPVLQWKDIREEDQTYDMCIWTPEPVGPRLSISQYRTTSWGKPAYCVQNLTVNYHKVKKRLMPDTRYNWSVRLHKGEEVFTWGAFSQTQQILTTTTYEKNIPYGFTTPQDSTPDNSTPDTADSDSDAAAAIAGTAPKQALDRNTSSMPNTIFAPLMGVAVPEAEEPGSPE